MQAVTSDAQVTAPPPWLPNSDFELGFLHTFSQRDKEIVSQCLLGTRSHEVYVFQRHVLS